MIQPLGGIKFHGTFCGRIRAAIPRRPEFFWAYRRDPASSSTRLGSQTGLPGSLPGTNSRAAIKALRSPLFPRANSRILAR